MSEKMPDEIWIAFGRGACADFYTDAVSAYEDGWDNLPRYIHESLLTRDAERRSAALGQLYEAIKDVGWNDELRAVAAYLRGTPDKP